jgi:hypothetical protein
LFVIYSLILKKKNLQQASSNLEKDVKKNPTVNIKHDEIKNIFFLKSRERE